MRTTHLRFPNGRGDLLDGVLVRPVGPTRGSVLFAHCFTCGKDLPSARRIADAFVDAGIAVLRFDFTGIGRSGGDHADTSFVTRVADLEAAAGVLRERFGRCDALLGHSLGGAAVLQAAGRIEDARAVVTIGAPASPVHVTRLLRSDAAEIARTGVAEVEIAGRRFRVGKRFFDDLDAVRMEEAIAGLRRPLLVMHAPLDEVVGIDNAARIFEAAKHPKSFLSLERADHLLRRPDDAHYAGAMAAAFVAQHLPPEPRTDEAPVDVHVRIGRRRYRTEVATAGHRWVADEPRSLGGGGEGPGPYELVAAGLGACTAMTLRMYADHKGIALDEVTVELVHEKRHAEDARACEGGHGGKVDHIERRIAVAGDLTDEQVARLGEIAGKCPVHRTLEGCVRINTTVRRDGEGA